MFAQLESAGMFEARPFQGGKMLRGLGRRLNKISPGLVRVLWPWIFPMWRRAVVYRGEEYGDRSEAFAKIYHENKWRNSESVSGPGSTLANTIVIRAQLPRLLKHLDARIFLDAPCGDYNWMRTVGLPPGVQYIGGDIVGPMIDKLDARYGDAHHKFQCLDIVTSRLPAADVWMCRHVLFHLSNEDARSVLENFVNSSIKYILTDTAHFIKANVDIRSGGYRLVNLRAAPFELPRPIRQIDDVTPPHPPSVLGLWSREQVEVALKRSRSRFE